ncbi:hypothetical protein EMIHUDRAFT_461108 [Emiliania huxleyi CCMP1516]|uniref:Major facilitator superfamily (MFS) profile domain-containing protein n=2 Tax=Emiliania huxleyi TaxID=2903 RepID=A0A0D3L2B7_EMIH1|nr:hypothetical protein EMIHUDRAFT_461108 [Emiliania huxleyi CCMP1516]EOD42152.1 hypothetical protein EMIHUDRAFT_461108 [Emiliania huxleyi CCMP1516]|eukprot:XP_005794581.1 hypothetical protein EMIHUDRAFT_461108 [Emiliania huxleyi CCMP1516]
MRGDLARFTTGTHSPALISTARNLMLGLLLPFASGYSAATPRLAATARVTPLRLSNAEPAVSGLQALQRKALPFARPPLAPRRRRPPPVCSASKVGSVPLALDPHRWVQLGILSMLALLSDWTCFATVAVPSEWMTLEGHDAAELIDIFLASNVVSCFLFTDIAARLGLKKVVTGAATMMAGGCLLRSGIPFVEPAIEVMPGYGWEVAGTILVGMAQPFFQCTPPLLSATWFGSSERALATATAINFNQVGIATAFIVGGLMANSPEGMHAYFDVLACVSIAAAAATALLFRDRPETPPSASAAAAAAELAVAPPPAPRLEYPRKALALLRSPGFGVATASFVASIGCTNIDLAGAGFQLAIVLGGIGLGGLVDRNKNFKLVILSCLLSSVSYPCDENAVEATQQLAGNLFSALLVPICQSAAAYDLQMPGRAMDIRGDTLVLLALVAATAVAFSSFDAPLERTRVDDEGAAAEL